jgi:hypothetical protein
LLDGKYIKNIAVPLKAIEIQFCSMANKINIDRWQKGEESYSTPKTNCHHDDEGALRMQRL